MLKKVIWCILFIVLIQTSCYNRKLHRDTPMCLDEQIKKFKKTCCANGANVKLYLFNKQSVYVFNPGNCGADMSSQVYDEKCNTLGHLGGFIGNTKINGEDFSKAEFVKIVWEK